MNDKDELSKVKAELAALRADLAATKAETVSPEEKRRAENAAKRATLKAETVKEGAEALYFIPANGSMFYRKGVCYPPGSVVRLPLAEEPSVTWQVVERVKPGPAGVAAKEPEA